MKELLRMKSVKVMLLVIVLLVAAGIIGINAWSASPKREYNNHMEVAQKYLTELAYEQAIAEYTLALEIEPNAEEVLNGLEQAYLAYAQSLADAGDYEGAVSVLEAGYAQTKRESLREKSAELQALEAGDTELQAYLQKLYELMAQENYADALKTMWEAGQSGYTTGLSYEKFIYFPEKSDSLTGTGIGLYRFHDWDGNVDTSYYENLAYYSYYYGSYVDGKREGYGVSVFGFYVFMGEWKNDAPEGRGELIVRDDSRDGGFASRIRGNLTDGLWDGTVERQWYDAEDVLRSRSFQVNHGAPEDKTEEYLASVGQDVSFMEERLAGQYVYDFFDLVDHGGGYYSASVAALNHGDTIGIWEFASAWE